MLRIVTYDITEDHAERAVGDDVAAGGVTPSCLRVSTLRRVEQARASLHDMRRLT